MAPTVGLVAPAGVKIRTGNLIGTGERIISVLVQRFGALDFVSDNAGCFGTRPLPRNGLFVKLGAHKVYVAVDVSCVHPRHVVDAGEPPLTVACGARIARSPDHPEVMMTAPGAGASKDPATDSEVTPDMVIPYGYVTSAYLVQPKEGPRQTYAGP